MRRHGVTKAPFPASSIRLRQFPETAPRDPGRDPGGDLCHRRAFSHGSISRQTAQITAGNRVPGSGAGRAEFLDAAPRAWQDLDPDDHPFIRAIAEQMREHDEREQFLAGIDLVLTCITTIHPPATSKPSRTRTPRYAGRRPGEQPD
ncbi:hypothetical protein [Pseudonocardia adelaidensis]|uniref:Tetracycline repressor TetR C-terminal domain-containing protein n=1 Tax=Pseudonocardia adelaidensis TaxID=648754 RepID=A0ABP9NJE7_9PSEU